MRLPEGAESRYLANTVGMALQIALAEVSVMRPRDPIEFLARSLYRYAENLERNEKERKEEEKRGEATREAQAETQRRSDIHREDHVIKKEQERRKRIYLEREKEVELLNSPRSRKSSVSSELAFSMNAGLRQNRNELNVPGVVPGVNSPEPVAANTGIGQLQNQSQGEQQPSNVSDNVIEVPVVAPASLGATSTQQEQPEQTTIQGLNNGASEKPQEASADPNVLTRAGDEQINANEENDALNVGENVDPQVANINTSSSNIQNSQQETSGGGSGDNPDKTESAATNNSHDLTPIAEQTTFGDGEKMTAQAEMGNSIDSGPFHAASEADVTSQVDVEQGKASVDVNSTLAGKASPTSNTPVLDSGDKRTMTSDSEQTTQSEAGDGMEAAGEQIDPSSKGLQGEKLEEMPEEKEVDADSSKQESLETQKESEVTPEGSEQEVEQKTTPAETLEGEGVTEKDPDTGLYTIGEQDED